MSGCSSGVEHNLAKVGVEGSNPFARSNSLIACCKFELNLRSCGDVTISSKLLNLETT